MSRRRRSSNDDDALMWILFILFLCLILGSSGCSLVHEEKCIDGVVHYRWGNTQFWTMETDLGRPVRCAL